MQHPFRSSLAVACSLTIAACGSPATGARPTVQPQSTFSRPFHGASALPAVAGTSAVGSLVLQYNDESASEPSSIPKGGKGRCRFGHKFFSPDRAGTPDSSEAIDFYDDACRQMARDADRVWSASSSSSETVVRTVKFYKKRAPDPTWTRTEHTTYTDAVFGRYGFPVVADGFVRETQATLNVGAIHDNVISDTETVLLPSSSSVHQSCTDSAGYNDAGISGLNQTFGWEGGAFGGSTRTIGSDGSVIWNATQTGDGQLAPVGGFSIAVGSPNTACPIVTPAYSLVGGSVLGTFTIPIVISYDSGVISSVNITNATLANTFTLNASSNPSVRPGNQSFIRGTITQASVTVAFFALSAFGSGSVTVIPTNQVFTIQNWTVIR